jgi:hypothetical protein
VLIPCGSMWSLHCPHKSAQNTWESVKYSQYIGVQLGTGGLSGKSIASCTEIIGNVMPLKVMPNEQVHIWK